VRFASLLEARFSHSSCFLGRNLYVFGGQNLTDPVDSIEVLNTEFLSSKFNKIIVNSQGFLRLINCLAVPIEENDQIIIFSTDGIKWIDKPTFVVIFSFEEQSCIADSVPTGGFPRYAKGFNPQIKQGLCFMKDVVLAPTGDQLYKFSYDKGRLEQLEIPDSF